ncbi:hypothetical protein DQ04_00601230 [Trypanosoma grayi]|uniref:hypothetical protein n=1 Tax=Trypanosoma grayi TaxID=71804 RepID=UPI0004F4B1BB|nr:hypothetical protein DQ04_00601230 [Trypanosoma grayi]KEG14156.1 hypothetical protein DQ04_00601230 [Trypanosoma grayi]
MSDVDQLIDELFPKGSSGLDPATHEHKVVNEAPASQADWDASDSEKESKSAGARMWPAKMTARVSGVAEKERETSRSYFDDSDESDFGEGAVVASTFTVPFPFLPSNISGACKGKCFVTNVGAENLHHPSIAQLLLVAEGRYNNRLTKKELLKRKGAFHVLNPNVGNGASDKYAEEAGHGGGCPLIVCRKCNYAVIRLQGAAWQDGGGSTDLYLTVRNFYPDWSRLASSYPVGQIKSGEQNRVLKANPGSAAYCCQCSWLTVKSPQEAIETRLTDPAGFVGREETCCFATQLPLVPGEKRRPPLWVCRGHVVQF